MERRLAAIFAADVVGYSRLMGADEVGTLERLKELRQDLIEQNIAIRKGRIVKLIGDGLLAEFTSVVEAVQCAVEIQKVMATRELDLPEEQRIKLRIGVNLGDVIVEEGDIYGDGINVASRLEALAEPGGVCISAVVYDSIRNLADVEFSDAGEHAVKNIERPVHVFTWPDSDRKPAVKTGLSLPDKPSISVLPFDNLSGDPEQEYFADGVVESITAALSRIRAFFVIARNSAFAYKGRHVNVREIGQELGVAYVLEGSVQRAGNRVRITAQLIETKGGAHLWAEKYDGSLDDIFDLQDRITEQVAGALHPSIRLAEIERAHLKRPQDLGSYDYTMRAMRHVWMLEKDEASKALELLEKALEVDPDYPLALALAAWCWAQRSVYNWVNDIDMAMTKALARAERAASLSSDDPLILAVLGAAHTFARNYGAARVLLERAIALDPNSAWALSRLGWLETYADRPEQAKQHFERAMRLSPLDPMNFNNLVGLAAAHQVAGDDSAAADLYNRALQERPNAHWIHRNLAAALHGAGREMEALTSRNTLLAAYPDMTVEKFKNAMVFSQRVLDRIGNQLLEIGIPEN